MSTQSMSFRAAQAAFQMPAKIPTLCRYWPQMVKKTLMPPFKIVISLFVGMICSFCAPRGFAGGSSVQVEQTSVISPQRSIWIEGSTSPQIAQAADLGRTSGNEVLTGVTFLLKQTPEQAQALERLLLDQQIYGNARYHRWLTPKEYGAQFGVPSDGVRAVVEWLASKGFTRARVNASRTSVSFDGDVNQLESALSTVFHRYSASGRIVLANTKDISLPIELGRLVDGVVNTNQFKPAPQAHAIHSVASPSWTSTQDGKHFVSPADLKAIYDFAPVAAAGYTGKGQRIAVVGQSAIEPADIARFRAAAGVTVTEPKLVLVPDTGAAVRRPGDELESDIDLEYAGATAPDADIVFVYTGGGGGHSVFDALIYAVDQDIAPVIVASYGQCEKALSRNELSALERALMQAEAQGQTVLAASGDTGATACETDPSGAGGPAVQGLGVQYPASSSHVTSIGGTMFADAGFSTYWTANTAPNGGSAEGYIPEQAWSESRGAGQALLFASGGGRSVLFPKPDWQIASGVPDDQARDVPDISFAAGIEHDGYIVCSSDSTLQVQGSCSHGFFDSTDSHLVIAGGTSVGSPIAGGVAALLDQVTGVSLGNLNAQLYSLAATAPAAFHDITAGTNQQPCLIGRKDCLSNGVEGYSAGPGYDLVTGLGTPDVGLLVAALKAHNRASMSLQELGSIAQVGSDVRILAVVSASSTSPGGKIQPFLDGTALGDSITTSDQEATFTFSPRAAGVHTVSAVFTSDSGDTIATARLTISVQEAPGPPKPGFTLSAAPDIAPSEAGTSSTITVTPSGSYSGKVSFTAETLDPSLLKYGCYAIADVETGTASSASTVLTFALSAEACRSLAATSKINVRAFAAPGASASAYSAASAAPPTSSAFDAYIRSLGAIQFCGALVLTGLRKRFKCNVVGVIATLAVISAVTACSVTANPGQVSTGTYTVLVQGRDTQHPAIAASISMPFKIE